MNAPRELAELLARWAVIEQGNTVLALHGGDTIDAWREHVHAMDLVARCGRILDAMEQSGRSVAHYRRSEAEWVKGLIAPDRNWHVGVNDPTPVIAQTTIDQLMALADVVDGESDRYRVSDPGRSQSVAALDELVSILGDPDALALSELERRYAFELVNSVRTLLAEASVFDGLDLARRIHELVGYLTVIADDLDDRNDPTAARKLRNAARRVRPFVVNGTIIVAGAVDVAANIRSLTS